MPVRAGKAQVLAYLLEAGLFDATAGLHLYILRGAEREDVADSRLRSLHGPC